MGESEITKVGCEETSKENQECTERDQPAQEGREVQFVDFKSAAGNLECPMGCVLSTYAQKNNHNLPPVDLLIEDAKQQIEMVELNREESFRRKCLVGDVDSFEGSIVVHEQNMKGHKVVRKDIRIVKGEMREEQVINSEDEARDLQGEEREGRELADHHGKGKQEVTKSVNHEQKLCNNSIETPKPTHETTKPPPPASTPRKYHCLLSGHIFSSFPEPLKHEDRLPDGRTRNWIEELSAHCQRCGRRCMEKDSYICGIAVCGAQVCKECKRIWERERRKRAVGSWGRGLQEFGGE